MINKKQKLYCYVDETGQDTKGDIFLVSLIVSGLEKEVLLKTLARIEKFSGKGRVKWMEAKHDARISYMQQVIRLDELKGKMYFALHRNTKDYFYKTAETVALTLQGLGEVNYEAIVLIDGMPRSLIQPFGPLLRKWRIKVEKVRGVRKSQADELMRLADSLCGFVRLVLENKSDQQLLFNKTKQAGIIVEILPIKNPHG